MLSASGGRIAFMKSGRRPFAAALRDVPVLHIYADNDTVVPTRGAERFNGAHGSVDRLVHRGNHDTLLYFMNSQASRIRSWLRSHGME